MNGSDVFVRAGDLVKNRSGVRFLSEIVNTYVVDCDEHEAVLVNGHWMGAGYSAQSFTMMTLNAHQTRMVGFELERCAPFLSCGAYSNSGSWTARIAAHRRLTRSAPCIPRLWRI